MAGGGLSWVLLEAGVEEHALNDRALHDITTGESDRVLHKRRHDRIEELIRHVLMMSASQSVSQSKEGDHVKPSTSG